MNTQRIIVGGLVAGVVIAAGQYVLSAIAALPGGGGTSAFWGTMPIPIAIMRSVVLGICCVGLYAGLRSQLKPGPRTAVTTGLIVFILGVAFPPVGAALSGTTDAIFVAIAGQAVVLPVATLAGAWMYRERAVARQAAAVGYSS